jgi:hypothetical protein
MAADVNGKFMIGLVSNVGMGKELPALTSRNETAMSNLPLGKQNEILVSEHPYSASDMKDMFDDFITGIWVILCPFR